MVQYKDDLLAANWTDLDGTVTAAGSTSFKVDDTASSGTKRFYRLRLVP